MFSQEDNRGGAPVPGRGGDVAQIPLEVGELLLDFGPLLSVFLHLGLIALLPVLLPLLIHPVINSLVNCICFLVILLVRLTATEQATAVTCKLVIIALVQILRDLSLNRYQFLISDSFGRSIHHRHIFRRCFHHFKR